ncbi:MAG TPA: DUF2779 domain-containing protein, partial [Candidatus Sulfotelmatobacter sp.]|nr:DUF2779 domain-containing protein [Candidatus Sulfotelmatobacter sp.]
MARTPAALSKSKYLDGLKCPKLLWYDYNRREEIPPFDPQTKAVMEEGQRVGRMAQRLFPGGIKLERETAPEKMSAKSLAALAERRPLFEAGFLFGRAYALADILVPVGSDEWDLIEVKSSTSVKGDYYNDVAFQKYTYTGAGLKVRQCFLMFLDREYLKKGEVDPERLFRRENISEKVEERVPAIAEAVRQMTELIAQPAAPEIKVGSQCGGCPLAELCWAFLPDEPNVFTLYRGEKTAFELMDKGVLKLRDIPADYELSVKHEIQRQALLSGRPHVNKKEIGEFLDGLRYPLYYLDFETIAPAVPFFDLTHPYEELPFQFSLHRVDGPGAEPVHFSYLAPGDVDPRPEVLRRLQELLGGSGTIVAFNAAYEMNCLRRATEAYPEYAAWFSDLKERFADLWEPFKNFYYYHPGQQASTSMKVVLPALGRSGYKELAIGEGWTARNEDMRVTFQQGIDPADRQRV